MVGYPGNEYLGETAFDYHGSEILVFLLAHYLEVQSTPYILWPTPTKNARTWTGKANLTDQIGQTQQVRPQICNSARCRAHRRRPHVTDCRARGG